MNLPEAFAGKDRTLINVVIETPKGSRNKFVYDEKMDLFQLRKILPSGTAFPLDFGFIPGTKGEDGDPLDVLVLMEQSTYPGCLVECKLIGVIKAEQLDKGAAKPERNDRLVAVPDVSVEYNHLKDIKEMGEDRLNDIIHFFKYYRMMSGGEFNCLGTGNAEEALELVKKGLT